MSSSVPNYHANNRAPRASRLQGVLLWLALIVPACIIEVLEVLGWGDFRFHRDAILDGEVWRMLTGHLDHISWMHLMLNAVFLAVCIALFAPLKRFVFTLSIWCLASLAISCCLLVFSPELTWYVGLSASLYTLLIVGVCLDQNYHVLIRAAVALGTMIKVIVEQGQDMTWISQTIDGPVAEVSHLYGVLVGSTFVVFIVLMRLYKQKAPA